VGFAQVKEEPAQRAGDTEQDPLSDGYHHQAGTQFASNLEYKILRPEKHHLGAFHPLFHPPEK